MCIRLTEERRQAGPLGQESCDFSKEELDSALKAGKMKGAEGPDGIAPRFLKNLGEVALDFDLDTCNRFWREGECPQSWRDAVIIPNFTHPQAGQTRRGAKLLLTHRPDILLGQGDGTVSC